MVRGFRSTMTLLSPQTLHVDWPLDTVLSLSTMVALLAGSNVQCAFTVG